MKKYIIYRLDAQVNSGTYYIVTITEAFDLIGLQASELPKLKIKGSIVNQVEVEQELNEHEIVRLDYNSKEWVIMNVN
jgi:hypothetical protein